MPPLETIAFTCPHCQQPLTASASAIATKVTCVHCKKKVKVPSRTLPKATPGTNVVVTGFALILVFALALMVLVPSGMYLYALFKRDNVSESVEQERKALTTEGQTIAAQKEQADRDHDSARLKAVQEHEADYQRRAAEFRRKHGE